MFFHVVGVGLMDRQQFQEWRKMAGNGRNGIVPPPYYESDLPLERVRPLAAEQEAVAFELLTEALVARVRAQGFDRHAEKLAAEARAVGAMASQLLAQKAA